LEAQVESAKAHEMLALQDPLTQLANRRMLQQALTQEMARSKRSGRPFAMALMDLDRFKEINDKYGHDSGDELLKAFAARIRQVVRSGDLVVRLGGDEFVVLFHNCEGDATFENALMRLLNKTSGEYLVNERVLTVGVSVGVAVYPHDGEDQQELLKNADTALYRAKAEGRNSYRFFSDAAESLDGVPQSASV
jgi:diguanylate cyclase (GGDEF)-like protein